MAPGDLPRRLGLNEEQTRAVGDTEHDILVSAGAGTGKTRVLVARYLVMILEGGYRPAQVAAITFTNKAAAEMRERIRRTLAELAGDYPVARELAVELNWAPIQTIHSFCGDLLHRYPLAAGIEPGFGVLEEGEGALLLATACEDALAWALSSSEEPPGLQELLESFGRPRLLEQLAEVHRNLAVWGLAPQAGTDDEGAALLAKARSDLLAWWRGIIAFDRAGMPAGTASALADLAALGEDFQAAVEEAGEAPDQPVLAEVRRLLGGLRAAEAKEAALSGREVLTAFAEALAVARAERIRPPFLALLRRAQDAYQAVKSRRNMVDFADLELMARELLRREEVRRTVRRDIPVLLVDEFQDTNPLQWSIIEALWRGPDGCRLFAVGDVKQSIYGFRGADVRVMENLRRELQAGGGSVHTLQDNYRSRPALAGLVNLACGPLLGGDDAYEPLRPQRAEAAPVCAELLLVEGENLDRVGEAALLAAKIAGLLRSGPPIQDPETGSLRPLVPGDLAVLLRAATNLAFYERALRQAGLPYRISVGGGFYNRREVRDLLSLLRVVEDRRDGVALAAALRSPLFAVSDTGLFQVAGETGLVAGFYTFDPSAPSLGQDGPRLARARELIQCLIARRHLAGLEGLLAEVMEETDYRALQAAYPDYRQRLANLDKLLALAGAYSRLGRGELGEFLAYLQNLESLAVRESEAALASGGDAVTILTVHAAKGLEFPVVFLPDLGRTMRANDGPILTGPDGRLGFRFGAVEEGRVTPIWRAFHDDKAAREEEEAKRLLYVALTRARDYLYLIGSGERAGASWLGWLRETLPGAAEGATVVYPQGEMPIIREIPEPPPAKVRETLAGRYPGILRGEAVIAPAEAAAAAEPGEIRPPAHQTVPVLTISGLLAFLACPRQYFLHHLLGLVEPAREPGGGGGGPALGTAVHALAAEMSRGRRESPRQAEERLFNAASSAAVEVEEVRRLLDNYRRGASFDALATAGAVWTEYEFRLFLGDGSLVGAIDLVWRDGDGDFGLADLKTNRIARPEGSLLAEHTLQVRLYALALARIFGRPPRAAKLEYLWPGISREVVVDADSLARVEEEARAALAYIANHRELRDYAVNSGEACQWCGYRRTACQG